MTNTNQINSTHPQSDRYIDFAVHIPSRNHFYINWSFYLTCLRRWKLASKLCYTLNGSFWWCKYAIEDVPWEMVTFWDTKRFSFWIKSEHFQWTIQTVLWGGHGVLNKKWWFIIFFVFHHVICCKTEKNVLFIINIRLWSD